MEQPILPFGKQYKKYYQSLEPILNNKQTKNYSTVIFFFLVLSIFGWYAIRPTIQTILYLRREIKDKTEVNKKMDEKINILIETNAKLENSASLLPLIEEAIPQTPKALELIDTIKTLAKETNASLSAVQLNNIPLASTSANTSLKKSSQRYASFPIMITTDGSFPASHAFFQELTNLRRVITIESITFSPFKPDQYSSTSAKPSLKSILQLNGYYTQ